MPLGARGRSKSSSPASSQSDFPCLRSRRVFISQEVRKLSLHHWLSVFPESNGGASFCSSSSDASSSTFGARVEPKASGTGAGESSSEPATHNGISPAESFDLAYTNIRAMTDSNLLDLMEREIIQRALNETGGNQVKAASLLGITRTTLRKRIDAYGLRF